MPGHVYYVYIMASISRTLYTGVTNFLRKRVFDHKSGTGSKFTAKYNCRRCVYFEVFDEITVAIAREKQVKGLTRKKKIALIESCNPSWEDLFEWLNEHVEAEKIARATELAPRLHDMNL